MRALILSALVGIALSATAAGAARTTNPKNLLLRASDVPAGAKRLAFGGTSGGIKIPRTVRGKAAYVAYRFKNGKRTEAVASAVGTLASTRDAHDVFIKLRKDARKAAGGLKTIRLQKLGDEQIAVGSAVPLASSGVVVVRSGTVIWEIVVAAYPGFSKARAKAELVKYARRGKARAGGGGG
jgi:hypothetical protein